MLSSICLNSDIIPYPMFSNNFGYIICFPHKTVLIDPADIAATNDILAKHQLTPNEIWITHHHFDHQPTIPFAPIIVAPSLDRERYPLATHAAKTYFAHDTQVQWIALPGHTFDHVGYYLPSMAAFFCGDTLFHYGCGRVLGGTLQDLHSSLQWIKALPPQTFICSAHNYTQNNLAFMKSQNISLPQDQTPQAYFPLGPQITANPFLTAADFEAFVKLRQAKDIF